MFDYEKFDAQCASMNRDELLKQHKHYAHLSTVAASGTAVSAVAFIPTLGLSGVGILGSAPAHHMAKKKKHIVERYLQIQGIEAAQAARHAKVVELQQQQQQLVHQRNASLDEDMHSATPSPLPYDKPFDPTLQRQQAYTISRAHSQTQPQSEQDQQPEHAPSVTERTPQPYNHSLHTHLYPESAIYHPHPGDHRHVHFA